MTNKEKNEQSLGGALSMAASVCASNGSAGLNTQGSPWVEKFKGTPFSIAVPPYIRFLQGIVILHSALVFLATAKRLTEHPLLHECMARFEDTKEAKELGINFETYFASQLAINLISEVEHYFANVLTAVLRMYPGKMGSSTFKLTEILSASSTDELVERAAEQYLNKLMYEKPQDYVKSLASTLSIDPLCLEGCWSEFVEAKARRDLGVHNNWVVNETYLRKTREAGCQNQPLLGESIIPNFDYVTRTAKMCYALVDDMTNAVAAQWLGENSVEK